MSGSGSHRSDRRLGVARRHGIPRVARLLAALGLAAGIVVVGAGSAAAHAVIVQSEPGNGSTLERAPRTASLRFSENLSAAARTVELLDAEGGTVAGARVRAADAGRSALTVSLPALPAGTYGLVWRVLAENDGHATSGVVVFTVADATGARTVPASRFAADAVGSDATRPADVALRWLDLAATVVALGALAVAGIALPRTAAKGHPAIRRARRRVLTLQSAASFAAAVAAAVGGYVARRQQAAVLHRATPLSDLLATTWGQTVVIRVAALAALATVALRIRSREAGSRPLRGRASWAVGAGLAAVVAVSEAVGGHAASAAGGRDAAMAAVALHLLAAGAWLGSLAALLVALPPRAVDRSERALVLHACRRRFAALAGAGAVTVVATGLVAAGAQVEAPSLLTTTTYGRALLTKLGLVAVVLAVGALNARALRGGRAGRLLAIEAVAGGLVVLGAAVLVQSAPPRMTATAQAPRTPPGSVDEAPGGSATAQLADLVVAVSATPDRPGINAFTVVVASSRRPPPAPIDAVRLSIEQAGSPVDIELANIGRDRWYGVAVLDEAAALRLTPTALTVGVDRAGTTVRVALPWTVAAAQEPATPAAAHGVPSPPAPFATPARWLAAVLVALAGLAAAGRRRRARRRMAPPDDTPADTASAVPQLEVIR
jgi:copper transport protein